MRFKKFLLVAALAAIPALGACDGDLLAPGAESTSNKAPTSRMDAATGEPVALNAPTADRVFTVIQETDGPRLVSFPEACPIDDPYCSPPPPCDPIYDFGCEPCPRDNPAAWCYQPPCTITSIIDTYRTQRTGDEPYAALEADGVGGTPCGGYLVLIGIGMRMDNGDNITTLHLKYQRVYSDGTFGPTELRKYGSEPNYALEGYAEALPGEAIVGIGVGSQSTHNIMTIRIWKRSVTLTAGGVRTTGVTTAESFGYSPGGVLDFQYYTTAENEVYVGAGARGNSSEVKTFAHHIGTLK